MSADLCPPPGKVPSTRKVLGDEFGERRKGRKEEASESVGKTAPLPAPGSEAKVIQKNKV